MTREDFIESLLGRDEALRQVEESIREQDMPSISVTPELGRLLTILVRASAAKRVLEIGALGGYSGICLCRGLPEDGRLVSLELKPEFADVARANVSRAGFGEVVEFRVGPALVSLEQLKTEGAKFDLVLIDADKQNYPAYLDYALALAVDGTLIVADNVLLGDRVMNPANHDPSPTAMRQFHERLFSHRRLDAVVLPFRDGVAIARVRESL